MAEETRDTHGLLAILRSFVLCTRAGATAAAAVAVTVIVVGSAALVSDHAWLVDQRDVLKTASEAAGIAATHELSRQISIDPTVSDADLEVALRAVAERYVVLNLQHLSPDRLAKAMSTLVITVVPNRIEGTVDVSTAADLGGTLLSRSLPLFGSSGESRPVRVASQVENVVNPIEVVLAIDVSSSMLKLINGIQSCTEEQVSLGCPAERWPEHARISIVRGAAKTLADTLGPSAENRIAIGVVPWHERVRLGPDAIATWTNNGWADYPTRRVYSEPYVCRGTGCTPPAPVEQEVAPVAPETWKGCLDSHRMGSVGTRAALPATSEFFKLPSVNRFAQAFFPAIRGAAYECMTLPLPAEFGWNICYHGQKYNRITLSPYESESAQHGCADANPAILPLSTDAEEIDEAIDALAPVGRRTYSALGLLWSQRLLDHSWKGVWGGTVHPVDPTTRDSEGLRKAIVLLTDGEDTHCGRGNHSCEDSPHGFFRGDACTEIKESGTEIFVIAAMHPDHVSDALGESLRECSSESPDSDIVYAFLNNSTRTDLEVTFSTIANQLRVVRRIY